MSRSTPKYYKKSKFLERFYLVLIIKHHVFVPKNNNILKRLDLLNYSINICIFNKSLQKMEVYTNMENQCTISGWEGQ
jgi:hypothetical protein